jgi:hypothetical protein
MGKRNEIGTTVTIDNQFACKNPQFRIKTIFFSNKAGRAGYICDRVVIVVYNNNTMYYVVIGASEAIRGQHLRLPIMKANPTDEVELITQGQLGYQVRGRDLREEIALALRWVMIWAADFVKGLPMDDGNNPRYQGVVIHPDFIHLKEVAIGS